MSRNMHIRNLSLLSCGNSLYLSRSIAEELWCENKQFYGF